MSALSGPNPPSALMVQNWCTSMDTAKAVRRRNARMTRICVGKHNLGGYHLLRAPKFGGQQRCRRAGSLLWPQTWLREGSHRKSRSGKKAAQSMCHSAAALRQALSLSLARLRRRYTALERWPLPICPIGFRTCHDRHFVPLSNLKRSNAI